ncbi:MAG: glycosyltransferase, partial [Promicromonosporaceae bacterium]|nr:glycosyltransferase [Promicromonosporaceae bacterium]
MQTVVNRYPTYLSQIRAWGHSPESATLRSELREIYDSFRAVSPKGARSEAAPFGTTTTMTAPAANSLVLPQGKDGKTVLILAHDAGVGGSGAERSHIETVAALVSQGYRVHTIARGESDKGMGGLIRGAGGSFSVIPNLPLWWWQPDQPLNLLPGDFTPPKALVDEVTAVSPDVIITQTAVFPQGALVAKMLGIPHIWYLHEYGDLDHGNQLPLPPKEFGQLVLGLSAQVLTNSYGVRDHFFGGPHKGVTVHHQFPDYPIRELTGPSTSRLTRPWTLGIAANLELPGKRQFDALNAIALLRNQGLDIHLRLYGYVSDETRAIWEGFASNLGVSDLLTLCGIVNDRNEMFSQLDAVAVTSRSEAFGRVPFEATAYGLPVIYANSAGPAEYLTDGETGLAFPPFDHVGLAAAIRSLHDHPEIGSQLVANARADLLSDTRRQEFVQTLSEVVEHALASDSPLGGARIAPLAEILWNTATLGMDSDDGAASDPREIPITKLFSVSTDLALRLLYQHFLKREPDRMGFRHYLDLVDQGATLGEVAQHLAESEEAESKNPGQLPERLGYVEVLRILEQLYATGVELGEIGAIGTFDGAVGDDDVRDESPFLNNLLSDFLEESKGPKYRPELPTIVLAIHDATLTGAPVLAWNLLNALSGTHNVLVLALQGGELLPAFREKAIAVLDLTEEQLTDSQSLALLAALIKDQLQAELVIANSVETHRIAAAFGHTGIPVISLIHEFSSDYLLDPGKRDVLEMFSIADQVVVPGEIVASSWPQLATSETQRKVRVLHQGKSKLPPGGVSLGNTHFDRVKRASELFALPITNLDDFLTGLDGSVFLVIGIGTISGRKGVDLFLQTAKAVNDRKPASEKVHFAWIGDVLDLPRFNSELATL